MQQLFDIPRAAIDHNIVFGALVGVESLFLMTRMRVRGMFLFWGLLLPVVLAVGVFDAALAGLLGKLHGSFLAAYLQILVSAICATGVLAMQRRWSNVDIGQDAELLLFASVAALLVVVPQWNAGNPTYLSVVCSGASLWLGFGIGLACFASLGGRLRGLAARSPFAGPFLFLSTLAIVALVIGAVTGLRFGAAP